jgi:hypothetical protein
MPKKTLEEMLNESTVQPGAKSTTKRLATFLKYWDEIEDAYKKGWPWLQIYNALHQEGIVDYSYSTFLHYKDKKRRRELEAVKHEVGTRDVDGVKGASIEHQPKAPGSTKVDTSLFGQGTVRRDPKRF